MLVVGGSPGIGLAAARMASVEGADVILVARDASRLSKAADEVRAARSANERPTSAVETLCADADDDAFDAFLSDVCRAGPVDHVLMTAASTALGPVFGMTPLSDQLARVLALELAPLCFNALSPGWTDTPMWDAMLGDQKAAVFAEVASRTPIGRLVASCQ